MKLNTGVMSVILLLVLSIIGIFFIYDIIAFNENKLMEQFGVNYNTNAYKLKYSDNEVSGNLDFLDEYDPEREFLVCADIIFYPDNSVNIINYEFIEYGDSDSVTVYEDGISKCEGWNTAIHSHDEDCHFSESDMYIYDRYINNNDHKYSMIVCDYGDKLNIATPNNFLGCVFNI